uniref:OsmC family peroxiredoxin n=1 Tax=Guillardia theta (strain CCMP2712) TaxID=905079 RepID=A0A0C3U9L1_GUITC
MLDFTTRINFGGSSEIVAELPPMPGQACLNPNPKNLVLSGLAACTSMTLQHFTSTLVKDGKLPADALKEIKVEVQDKFEAGKQVPDSIHVSVDLVGNLTPDQKKMIFQAIGFCPVKQMLSGKITGGIHDKLL